MHTYLTLVCSAGLEIKVDHELRKKFKAYSAEKYCIKTICEWNELLFFFFFTILHYISPDVHGILDVSLN